MRFVSITALPEENLTLLCVLALSFPAAASFKTGRSVFFSAILSFWVLIVWFLFFPFCPCFYELWCQFPASRKNSLFPTVYSLIHIRADVWNKGRRNIWFFLNLGDPTKEAVETRSLIINWSDVNTSERQLLDRDQGNWTLCLFVLWCLRWEKPTFDITSKKLCPISSLWWQVVAGIWPSDHSVTFWSCPLTTFCGVLP